MKIVRNSPYAVVLLGGMLISGLLLCADVRGKEITEADRQHWAFQPLKPVQPPVLHTAKTANPIDLFILARLQTNRLEMAPAATKEQLIRRVSFGLIGLPPTIEEIDNFIADSSPRAYERLIDRLLSSPHYGERWARHWLDLARFGESDGFEHDAVRPHAWRYRQYVIDAFNADKPYDQFIREQIAGDELFPDRPDALIATSFNLLGPDMVDSADQVQRRHNTLNDMTDTMALVFLGQTIGCARCHNHKFEPFSQRDYYQLQAFFSPTKFEREFSVPTAAQRKAYEAEMAKYESRTQIQRKQIDALEAPHRARLYEQKLAKLSEEARVAHQTPKEKRTVEMQNQVHETEDMVKISDAELVKTMSGEEKGNRKALLDELKAFPKPAAMPQAMVLQDGSNKAQTFVLRRGDYNNPTDEVQPGFPEILQSTASTSASRRSALAEWLVRPDNPLTARVMVNRIWQHHFGRGIVETPSEFGTRGTPPTHPELLDWLANQFIAQRWSIKALQKLILLSAAYQQSSVPSSEALARDRENKLFSRQNRVRLEGEAVRDSLLAISGRLNPKVGGPSIFPPIPQDIVKVSKNWTASADSADHARRSIYIFTRRNLRFPFLEVFDAADSNLSCPQRGCSTTAPQALTLLNSEEVMLAAKAATARFWRKADSTDEQIVQAFRRVTGRKPTGQELKLGREFIASGASPEEFFRALFNLNAFVYVD